MQIPTADLAPIRDLYGRGLYIQALRAADRFGPLTDWSNTAARLLGGRLALQLGAARLGRWLHLRAYRDTPAHPEAIYYHARYRLEKFGPVSAWRFLRSHPDQEWYDAAPEVRADWYGLHAFVCGRLRDFDRADRWLAKAEALAHDRAWLCVERAAVFEFAERYDEALAVARHSRDLVPFFRPGVQAEAHLLQHTGKMRAALDLLVEASAEIESGIVAAHLAALQIDLRHYNDARQSYERYAELSPLMDEETGKWLAARRADSAYFCGDGTAAAGHAETAGEDFYTAFAARLAAAGNAPIAGPVRLDFPPGATPAPLRNPLDSFPRFWGVAAAPAPADGAPADGLQDPRERLWAVANGFAAAEFTVTPTAAFALVERGLPFLVTMVDAGYSHSQMVVGADRLRHSLWLHEGADGRANETPLGILIDRYAATGPRGLVVVPMAAAGRLAGLELPDATRYDGLHAVQTALLGHDRPTAQKAVEAMAAADPGHLLTRLARLAIARYDANPTLVLHAVLSDPDRLAEVRRAMARAVRQRPYAPAGYYILGNVLWEEREFQSATDMYRFAAAMEDRDEQFAESYFRAARATGQTADAMRFLTARYERTKGTLAGPARAMFYALSEQDEDANVQEPEVATT